MRFKDVQPKFLKYTEFKITMVNGEKNRIRRWKKRSSRNSCQKRIRSILVNDEVVSFMLVCIRRVCAEIVV